MFYALPYVTNQDCLPDHPDADLAVVGPATRHAVLQMAEDLDELLGKYGGAVDDGGEGGVEVSEQGADVSLHVTQLGRLQLGRVQLFNEKR